MKVLTFLAVLVGLCILSTVIDGAASVVDANSAPASAATTVEQEQDNNHEQPVSFLRVGSNTNSAAARRREEEDEDVEAESPLLLPTCVPVGVDPFQTTVYSAVTYDGPNFDFNNITTLEQLESSYLESYNSFQICESKYLNGFKDIGLTFVLSADSSKKQYLIGSRIRTNAGRNTCSSSGNPLSAAAVVPELYRSTNATGPIAVANEDCNCFGPFNETLVGQYNTQLQDIPVETSTILNTQNIIGIEQLCVSENCSSSNSNQITFDLITGFVQLPCNGTDVQDADSPTRSPTKRPTKRPTVSYN